MQNAKATQAPFLNPFCPLAAPSSSPLDHSTSPFPMPDPNLPCFLLNAPRRLCDALCKQTSKYRSQDPVRHCCFCRDISPTVRKRFPFCIVFSFAPDTTVLPRSVREGRSGGVSTRASYPLCPCPPFGLRYRCCLYCISSARAAEEE